MKNKKILKWHSMLGLLSGIFILMMGVSGSILVFHEEIDEALEKDLLLVAGSGQIHIDQALINVQDAYPNWDTRIVKFDDPNKPIIIDLRQNNNEQRLKAFMDPASGKFIKVINANNEFTRWLLKFHYSLRSGIIGKLIIFLVGIFFTGSLITGLVLYRKSIVKVLLFRVKIKRKNKRTLFSSIHRILGVWSLLLNLLLVITGLTLSYTIVNNAFKTSKVISTPKITISLNQLIDDIHANHSDFHPSYIRIPTSPAAPITIFGTFDGDSRFWSKFYNSIQIDYATADIISVKKVRDQPLAYKITSMVQPLHFGSFAGRFSKICYCILGLTAPTLSITGFYIWFSLKQKK